MSASLCPNCQRVLSCDCQLRPASDHTIVCDNCVADHEHALKDKKKS